ncbi:hypothetical protein HER18_15605 [Chryseobacterium sp. NEB161]|nr:hypothetical protein HER18_15605 [Chryseobacterium sp. NEB161]
MRDFCFLGLRWGKALQGYLQAFPPKAIRQINNDMNEKCVPRRQNCRNGCATIVNVLIYDDKKRLRSDVE